MVQCEESVNVSHNPVLRLSQYRQSVIDKRLYTATWQRSQAKTAFQMKVSQTLTSRIEEVLLCSIWTLRVQTS